ncbi:MAG: class I SAM-dependent methyltransferase [Prolixibacteraceae bacterium]|nr:class I SAM-dependent methyltransferase [Prolixibacteraceae bacterium]
MRKENISRLSKIQSPSKKDIYYLHYISLFRDIEYTIKKHGKGRVIDIGCGNKPYELLFQDSASEYIGCDIIQSDLAKVDVICEADNIPLPDNSFDTVLSTQTIEHIGNHQGLVNEAFRLLNPGGIAIISGPSYWPLHEEPYDYFRFTKYGLTHILENVGFEVIEILPNGGMWSTTGIALVQSLINSKSRSFFLRVMRSLFYRLKLVWMINTFFGWLDRIDYNPINTMNYVVVAKKPNL